MNPLSTRRRFLRQLLGVGAFGVAGLDSLPAQPAVSPVAAAAPFRFAFLTDLHLMSDSSLRSAQGIAACLTAMEKVTPRPEFILVGGDLVHNSRDLTIPQAEASLAQFLKIWHDHTDLPAYWTFGNHDLVGTNNATVSPHNSLYAKGLFQRQFKLRPLYYSFDYKGWHFIVLDDIGLRPSGGYFGELFEDELRYLRADLDAHRASPTIICTHIPILSNAPIALHLLHDMGFEPNQPKSLVCTNGAALISDLPGHNVRAVLAGHLHFHEVIEKSGVTFINSGAVCGNFWRGPLLGCPEGFGIVDLQVNGTVAFDYRPYGWKAT